MKPDVTMTENYINPNVVDVFESNLWSIAIDDLIGAEVVDVAHHRDDKARENVIDAMILKLKNGEIIHILASENAILCPEVWMKSYFLDHPCDGTPEYIQEMLKQGKQHIFNE
jgi:superoxide dismutase